MLRCLHTLRSSATLPLGRALRTMAFGQWSLQDREVPQWWWVTLINGDADNGDFQACTKTPPTGPTAPARLPTNSSLDGWRQSDCVCSGAKRKFSSKKGRSRRAGLTRLDVRCEVDAAREWSALRPRSASKSDRVAHFLRKTSGITRGRNQRMVRQVQTVGTHPRRATRSRRRSGPS